MCVQDAHEMENLNTNSNSYNSTNRVSSSWPLHFELLHSQMDNLDKDSSFTSSNDQLTIGDSFPVRLHFFLVVAGLFCLKRFFFFFMELSLGYLSIFSLIVAGL